MLGYFLIAGACFIFIVTAIPATAVLISMEDTKTSDMTIKIAGHQWR